MLARADHDFVLGQVRPSRKGQKRRRMQWLRALFRRPGRVIVGAAATAVGVGIIVNALALQGGPHPAPLFKPQSAEPKQNVAAAPASKPLPVARPAELTQQAAAPARPAMPAAAAPAASRDAISDMLRAGTPQPAPASSSEPSKIVLAAQRALNKLNYGPIKPDGLFGPGTRQAIERFERDRRIPVTGEPFGRTARELANASGIPVD